MKRSTAEYIHSVPDLLANQHVLFGTLDSGSTYNFFRVNNYPYFINSSGADRDLVAMKYFDGFYFLCKLCLYK